MNLKDKVAIITGGGTGIGYGIAQVLAEKGAKLAIAQFRLERVKAAIERLKETEVLPMEVDLRDPSSVERMVGESIARFGRIDILINNAGITGTAAVAPFLDCPLDKVDEIINVNIKGTLYCSQLVARHMVESGRGGSIVHISSVGAFAAQEMAAVYCMTKAGLVALTRAMAIELAPHAVRVNCVAPGDILTKSSATMTEDKKLNAASGLFERRTPLGHRGKPSDIGYAVAYLVSDEACFVTGTTLTVDGGLLAY